MQENESLKKKLKERQHEITKLRDTIRERDEDQIRWEKEKKLHKKEISEYETQKKKST